MREEKCHRFWLTNRNPITMKKDERKLHIHNLSKEQIIRSQRRRQNIINALEASNAEYRANEVELTTYIYTLLERDTPEEYKEVVRTAVFGN